MTSLATPNFIVWLQELHFRTKLNKGHEMKTYTLINTFLLANKHT